MEATRKRKWKIGCLVSAVVVLVGGYWFYGPLIRHFWPLIVDAMPWNSAPKKTYHGDSTANLQAMRTALLGYEEGARSVNPNIRVVQNYVGVTDSAWNNPGKGKELALAQIGKGADVLFTAAGNSGLGAFDAVEQQGKENGRATHFVIGVDSNQNMVKPGFVLTSMVKRVDNAVYSIVQDVVNGKFQSGFHIYGLDKDGVGYSLDEFNKDLVSPEAIKEAEEAKRKIIAGEIKVTDAMAK